MTSEKLVIRTTIKKRKPTFVRRQAIRQFAKLKKSGWRAPKGMGNKQRRGRKGQPIKPTCGFGSPKEVRGLNKDGFKEVLVYNLKDIGKVQKGEVVVIASSVGGRKKLEILKEIKSKKLIVSNVKDVDLEIKKLTKEKKKEDKKKEVKKSSKSTSKKEKNNKEVEK